MIHEPACRATGHSVSRRLSLHSVEWEIVEDLESMMEEEIENCASHTQKTAQPVRELFRQSEI